MRRTWMVTALLATLVPAGAWAQGSVVMHTEARRYGGEEVTIQGPVVQVTPGTGGSLWLSLGEPYPKSTIVIVIHGDFARTLDDPSSFEGATIQAFGLVSGVGGSSGGARARGNTAGPRLQGAPPRTPYIVIEDLRRLKVLPGPTAAVIPPPAP